MRKTVLASVILFACGVLIGIAFPGVIARAIGPATLKMIDRADTVMGNNMAVLLFIFVKNVLVAFLLLAAGVLRRGAGAEVTGWPKILAAGKRYVAFFYPAFVLVLNGMVLSWITLILYRSGIPATALAGGLLPHGVIEMSAIIMCCGYAFAGRAGARESGSFFLRVAVPMLALAAAVEVYVSPVLMQKLL